MVFDQLIQFIGSILVDDTGALYGKRQALQPGDGIGELNRSPGGQRRTGCLQFRELDFCKAVGGAHLRTLVVLPALVEEEHAAGVSVQIRSGWHGIDLLR